MRKVLLGLVAVITIALVAPLFAATETVTGKIVDQSCYMKDKASNTGVDHKMPADTVGCALACAKKGRPMALLTSDGKVYELGGGLAANMNEKLIAHISHTVTVTGDVTKKPDGSMVIASDALKMVSR
jgi:type 1 fimbria pilin